MISDFITEKWEEVADLLGINSGCGDEEKNKYTLNYLAHVGKDGVWGTENDILILRRALQRDIYIISDQDTQLDELLLASQLPEDQAPIFLTHVNQNHFNAIYRNENHFISTCRDKREIKQSSKLIETLQNDTLDMSPVIHAEKRRREIDEEWNPNKRMRVEEIIEDISLEMSM
jgi:hypothetical protein